LNEGNQFYIKLIWCFIRVLITVVCTYYILRNWTSLIKQTVLFWKSTKN